jgi:hypothetical protein
MASHPPARTKSWTPERQVTFLAALAGARSVTAAARVAGMSRESAHRLRNRPDGALFAHIWDLVLAPVSFAPDEGHIRSLSDGRLTRRLGNHFRRESGEFARVGARRLMARGSDRT